MERLGGNSEIRVRCTFFSQIRRWRHRKDDFLSCPCSWVTNEVFPHIFDIHRHPMTKIVPVWGFRFLRLNMCSHWGNIALERTRCNLNRVCNPLRDARNKNNTRFIHLFKSGFLMLMEFFVWALQQMIHAVQRRPSWNLDDRQHFGKFLVQDLSSGFASMCRIAKCLEKRFRLRLVFYTLFHLNCGHILNQIGWHMSPFGTISVFGCRWISNICGNTSLVTQEQGHERKSSLRCLHRLIWEKNVLRTPISE